MYVEYQPSHKTARYVERFFLIDHSARTEAASDELILPDGTAGLLFMYKGEIRRVRYDGKQEVALRRVHLFGQKTKSVIYKMPGDQFLVFGIKFKPHSLHSVFGIDASELKDGFTEFCTVAGQVAHILEAQVASLSSPQEKIAAVEHFLITKTQTTTKHEQLMLCILADMKSFEGSRPVQFISKKYNLSYKFIERLFKRYVGITPKLYSRICRFNRSFRYFNSRNVHNFTDLAYATGYFDQMHFIKEVKSFTGLTPSELYIPSTKPIEQAQRAFLKEEQLLAKQSSDGWKKRIND